MRVPDTGPKNARTLHAGRRHSWQPSGSQDAEPKETTKIRTRSRTNIDHYQPLGPLEVPLVALPRGSATGLVHCFGGKYILTIAYYEHIIRGFVFQLLSASIMFIFKDYHTPPHYIAVYGSFEILPWCLKSIIGLATDLIPIFGYLKAPYIIISATCGTAAMFMVGSMTTDEMPIGLYVGCIFFATLQIIVSDVIMQGTYSRKAQSTRNPEMGTNLLAFIWFGINLGMVVASVSSGLIMKRTHPRMLFFICGFPAAVALAIPFFGFLEEKRVTRVEISEKRQLFFEQKEVCLISFIISVASVCMTIPTMSSAPAATIGILSLVLALIVLGCFSLLLSPAIAKMGAYAIITTMFSLNMKPAAFYFFTDGPKEFPDGPHLSMLFFTTVSQTLAAVSSLIGIVIFQRVAKHWTYRSWITLVWILFDLSSVLWTVQFLRGNKRMRIPDWVWFLATTMTQSMLSQMQLMPFITGFSYLSPKGMEATCFAAFTGGLNMAYMTAGNFSGWLIQIIGCAPAALPDESTQFRHLWLGSLWFVIHLPICLACRRLLPEETMNKTLATDYDATSDSLWQRMWRGCSPPPSLDEEDEKA